MRQRSPLRPAQIRRLWVNLAPQLRVEAGERMRQGRTLRQLPQGRRGETGSVRAQVAELAGISERNLDKLNAIYDAAEADPALFGPVVDYLERAGNIHDAYNRMNRLADIDRARRMAPIAGRFATVVLDPPWQDESVSENQRPPYATMTVDEIAAVPVPSWVGDKAHLYCHAPGPWVPIAVRLVQGWGFDFKQILTFHKSQFSMGRYFRTLDEYVVFATRGGLMLKRQDLPNHFAGPVGEHSAKPESFYDLVRAASPEPYGEAFQRPGRPDFTNLYAPADLGAACLEAAE